MTTTKYLAALTALGLTHVGAARLGMSRRQAQRIAAGACPVPKPIALLLQALLDLGLPDAPGYLDDLNKRI